mmetsp:Transcript_17198/g.19603  ORF Transcript_17198/g.19603 Transcript_17198/m.19603 type:complete len:177 (+) Transcript_17198:37-567(+)
MNKLGLTVFLVAALCVSLGSAEYARAVCYLNVSTSNVDGEIYLVQRTPDSPTEITVEVRGLTPNAFHGFHIHTSGNLTGGCDTTGPHFNPLNKTHGAPFDNERHYGDLGNIVSDPFGVVKKKFSDKLVTLSGNNSVIGRAFVVHEGRDDYGQGGFNDSKTTGHAGARIACGVIEQL